MRSRSDAKMFRAVAALASASTGRHVGSVGINRMKLLTWTNYADVMSNHPNSKRSLLSVGSDGSVLSLWSRDSVLSIGSVGSVLSIGSIGAFGSVLSVASFVSLGSIMSAGCVLSIMSWKRVRGILQ